ncbi:hypothetical protein JCM19000A_05590 [Silvimonas sp. JCM 19000]
MSAPADQAGWGFVALRRHGRRRPLGERNRRQYIEMANELLYIPARSYTYDANGNHTA